MDANRARHPLPLQVFRSHRPTVARYDVLLLPILSPLADWIGEVPVASIRSQHQPIELDAAHHKVEVGQLVEAALNIGGIEHGRGTLHERHLLAIDELQCVAQGVLGVGGIACQFSGPVNNLRPVPFRLAANLRAVGRDNDGIGCRLTALDSVTQKPPPVDAH